ncbi:MAG TPA: serine protein kinase, partial [Candidatus Binatia bacterium]|nr:serine protein kinase [Candidatus Binatia bacterium]
MNQEFESLIRKDRDISKAKSWKGNLLGYLDKVKEAPSMTKLAHARLHDIILRPGVSDIQDTHDPRIKRLYKDESVKVYNFFTDEFFGIEKTIAHIVRYFHAAALKGEESRQVLYLMGPV